jgi:hypothetical protein
MNHSSSGNPAVGPPGDATGPEGNTQEVGVDFDRFIESLSEPTDREWPRSWPSPKKLCLHASVLKRYGLDSVMAGIDHRRRQNQDVSEERPRRVDLAATLPRLFVFLHGHRRSPPELK